jgi:hypothetical protein
VTFLVEQQSEIEKLAETLEAGPRETVIELLMCNPLLVSGAVPKTYGWDAQRWDEREMHQLRAAPAYTRAVSRWEQGIAQLTAEGASPGHVLAFELLIDRLLHLSDALRIPIKDQAYYQLIRPVDKHYPLDARERIHVRFARSRDPWVVSRSLGWLRGHEFVAHYAKNSTISTPILDVMFEVADGPDQQLAQEAISSLSSFRPSARIAQFLRRKMTDPDVVLALHAAIVSCYSGDWSGLPVLLRCVRSDDPELRLKAIAQLGDSQFRSHADKIVPLLQSEVANPLSDKHRERALDSLRTYPR